MLCPAGHYVMGGSTRGWPHVGPGDAWGGSWLEARIAWHQAGLDPWLVTCHGTLPDPARPSRNANGLQEGRP